MKPRLQTLLPLIKPALARALAAPEALTRIENLMARLPLFSGGLLECRLDRQSSLIDLGIRATALEGGFKLLANPTWLAAQKAEGESAAASSADAENPANKIGWQRIRDFARALSDAQSPLRQAVREAWLEFDIQHDGDTVPTPSFFMRLEAYFSRPPVAGDQVASRLAESIDVIKHGLELLGVSFDGSRRRALEVHLKYLPASARLLYVGSMLGRQQTGYRLTFEHIPFTELTAYLRQIGWPQAREPIVAIINWLLPHVSHVMMHLDVDEQTGNRIGMEVSFGPEVDQRAAWRTFLKELTAMGLCTQQKAEAVYAWPAQLQPNQLKESWPESLPPSSSYFTRSINHIKLTYDAGQAASATTAIPPAGLLAATGALTAKAYLAFNYGSMLRRAIVKG